MLKAFIEKHEQLITKDAFVIILLVLLPPLGLYIMWKYKSWSMLYKVIISVIIPILIVMWIFDIEPTTREISIAPETVNLELDSIKLLDVKLTPENADKDNIVYVSSDFAIAKAKDGKVYSVSEGTTTIYAYDKKSKVKSNEITVRVATSLENLLYVKALESSEPITDDLVYITRNGEKYHLKDCTALKGTAAPVTKADAAAAGKTACSKCRP